MILNCTNWQDIQSMNSVVYMYWEIMVLTLSLIMLHSRKRILGRKSGTGASTKQMESCGLDPRSIPGPLNPLTAPMQLWGVR